MVHFNLLNRQMKSIKFLALAVVATFALSCTNDIEPTIGQKVKFTFNTADTKVWIDTANSPEGFYDFKFDGNEKLAISYNKKAFQSITLEGESSDEVSATLEVTDDGSGSHSFLVMTEYQKTANGNGPSTWDGNRARVTIPYVQTIRNIEGSLMPNRYSVVLYGTSEPESSLPERVDIKLKHATAYGKVDIKNFTLAQGEVLEQVQIIADKAISGTFDFDPADGSFNLNPKDSNTKNRYVINVKTSSLDNVWFSSVPNDALEEVTVYLQTNKYIYTKTLSFAGRKALQFKAGEVSRFAVDMTNALSQVVTDDAVDFNPTADEKYFIVISSEVDDVDYPSGDFVVRNNTCTLNPRAFYFPTLAQQGVDNFLWRIIKNADGTFSFLSLDPTAKDDDGNFNEYLWQCNGQAQGFCIQVDGTKGAKYSAGKTEYVNTFRLFDNTDEKYSDSFYMTSTNNIDANGTGTRWTCPNFFKTADDSGPSRYVSMRCATGKDTNKYRVRFIKYEEGKSMWKDQWALPGGDVEAPYMIIFDYWNGSKVALGALTHEVTAGLNPTSLNKKMVMNKFDANSATGLYSYTRPIEVGPFSQGELNVAEDFDYTNYTWYIKRDTSNPGTYFIYYKDADGKNHFLTQHISGTNLMVDNNGYSKNFKFVSFIYDNQEVLSLVVDKADGSGFRYMGYYWDSDVRSISAQKGVYSNIYLHKLSIE